MPSITEWFRRRARKRFLQSLPKVFIKDDGGEWIMQKFRDQIGRDFNPLDRGDRETILIGLNRATLKALPELFAK